MQIVLVQPMPFEFPFGRLTPRFLGNLDATAGRTLGNLYYCCVSINNLA